MTADDAITLQTTISHAPEIFWQEIDGDVVMLSTEHGKYFGSQAVGAEIWQLMAQATTVAAICDRLLQSYEVERETCQAEVLAFVKHLHQAGLIQVGE